MNDLFSKIKIQINSLVTRNYLLVTTLSYLFASLTIFIASYSLRSWC